MFVKNIRYNRYRIKGHGVISLVTNQNNRRHTYQTTNIDS